MAEEAILLIMGVPGSLVGNILMWLLCYNFYSSLEEERWQ